ncbi:hypothetical protein BC826DRAFT_1109727 [Russula brevipes]|nr:hypothetical protein BC826DRAFT_1109727 [Russula brevipes]
MSVRPLPGASYHTAFDAVLHSFANVDPEAVGSLNAYGPSEKMSYYPEESRPLLDEASSTRRRRRGLPAFWGYSPLRLLSPDVPERHVPLVDRLSTMLHSDLYRLLVNQNFKSAVDTMNHKIKCSHDKCHETNLFDDYIVGTFPHASHFLNRSHVGQSALVLHWQGTDSNLKPVLITNNDAVLGLTSDSSSLCGDYYTEHMGELADAQSGVGMLFAADTLLRLGYQPSRTLVLSLMLGEPSDAPEVSQFLRATYGGLDLGKEQVPQCNNNGFKGKARRAYRSLIGKMSGATVALRPASAASHCTKDKPFDTDAPRMFRYFFSPTLDDVTLTKLRLQATRVWARLILGADVN